ncbi:ACP S-malonyltransferase [Pseudohaliea rubra]|uniref:Malonyl CoA-acyl carrier protein transacylase n=1 Tax=Pseudohaliea rubra DSM 19751 TaxID=1265313 RepID=A0A095VQG7_9GAMM|nr:ACP S-malonyltransferase [Pseudohaliea rubra]KGE03585.1 Malonyl CoA-acyl carrier protein transacylase [Pseudohaliea rubra DSM 19751]
MTDSTLAFVFPGQGSQRTGMLCDAHARFECVRETFQEASDALGYDVWGLVSGDDQDALNLTAITQPVLLTCSVALWRAWQAAGGAPPAMMAGHSLGEFSALTCAGSFAFDDAVRLVRLRGEAMQTAVPVGEGAMAAVLGLDDAVIERICAEVTAAGSGIVEAVNYNAPGQVVIAGGRAALDSAVVALKGAGARRAVSLPVSAPFHTTLMVPAGERLHDALADLPVAAPAIPVVHNVNAGTASDPDVIRALLVKQISSPVRWTDCIRAMAASGVQRVAECGPGKVLGGLNRRIDRTLESWYLEAPADLDALQDALAA